MSGFLKSSKQITHVSATNQVSNNIIEADIYVSEYFTRLRFSGLAVELVTCFTLLLFLSPEINYCALCTV